VREDICVKQRVLGEQFRAHCFRTAGGRLFSPAILTVAVAAACNLPPDIAAPAPVVVRVVDISPNSNMVTAAVARVDCGGSVTALQVVYEAPGVDSGQTPRLVVNRCPAFADLLGLLASTTYRTTVTLWGSRGDSTSVAGPAVSTGPLPNGLPSVTVQSVGPSPNGLTAFAVFNPAILTDGWALIVDSVGRVRWYLHKDRFITDLQPQPGNRYTVSVAQPEPLSFSVLDYLPSEYQEVDLAGNFLRKWTTTGGFVTDNHELRFTSSGTAILMGVDFRQEDLSALGGSSAAQVLGNVLQEVDSLGGVKFQWNAFDYFTVTDIDPGVPLTTSRIDWNHGNAIDLDADGNYLVSFRNLSEITKIDSHTGNIIWRLGGRQSQFQFIGDTLKFSFQHGARRLPNGNLILFDNGNGHSPPFSRAIEYRLDEHAMTASAVWSYRPTPDIFSLALGLAQRLSSGNTLVTFGVQGTVHEVTPSSQRVWVMTLGGGYWLYRAYRIASLYEPSLK